MDSDGRIAMTRDWGGMSCSEQLAFVIGLVRDAMDAGDAGALGPVVNLLERVEARVREMEGIDGCGR